MNSVKSDVHGLSRREFTKIIGAVGSAGVLGSCGIGGSNSGGGAKGDKTKRNPLGVKKDAPLEVVIFAGGFGDKYAKFHADLYRDAYPDAKVSLDSIQDIQQNLQPRFVSGNPPDVIDNSGKAIPAANLVGDDQLTDLTELLESPSWDVDGKTVRETLLPGVVEFGSFDGVPQVMNYVFNLAGVWHSRSLFDKKGWEPPKRWDDMLSLCDEIKKEGIAPWVYPGQVPGYLSILLLSLAAKIGGEEALVAIDNLEPDAWRQDALKTAAAAVDELRTRGYWLDGSKALSHTEAQTEWVQGKAAFYVVGSWIENEMASITPDGFDMVMNPTPSMSTKDVLPYEAVFAKASEAFIVPSKAKNVQGGLEYLRIMLSQKGARKFAKLNRALPAVAGAADELSEDSTAFASMAETLEAAGDNTFSYLIGSWYPDLMTEIGDAVGALVNGDITVNQWADRCQEAADAVAADDSIEKFKR